LGWTHKSAENQGGLGQRAWALEPRAVERMAFTLVKINAQLDWLNSTCCLCQKQLVDVPQGVSMSTGCHISHPAYAHR